MHKQVECTKIESKNQKEFQVQARLQFESFDPNLIILRFVIKKFGQINKDITHDHSE